MISIRDIHPFQSCSSLPKSQCSYRVVRCKKLVLSATAGNANDLGENIKRFAKKIQGSLPIVGLLSRLASPEGGFDEQAYPEFCRHLYDTMSNECRTAMQDLEKKHGKSCNSRWVYMVLWMATLGPGFVAFKDIMNGLRRLRVTQDIEVEVERFETARAATIKKYNMMAPPEGKLDDKISVAVDGLCTLCLGLKDGEAVKADDVDLLLKIICQAVPEAGVAAVQANIANRASRTKMYL